jgi:hypothetical protein
VLKVKTPAGVTAGYILLYSNPESLKGQTDEADTGPHPASEPARALGRTAGRRWVDSRNLAAQDKIALDADEGKGLDLKRERAGQERVVWNSALSVPAKDFEFTDSEVARIKGVIETWDAYNATADRCWLEPLVEALFCATPQEKV